MSSLFICPFKRQTVHTRQTGIYVNERLREHNNTRIANSELLAIQCRDCECTADFQYSVLIRKNYHQLTCETIEAANIMKISDTCVSSSSIPLTEKKSCYILTLMGNMSDRRIFGTEDKEARYYQLLYS